MKKCAIMVVDVSKKESWVAKKEQNELNWAKKRPKMLFI